jgi:hypothetical protein
MEPSGSAPLEIAALKEDDIVSEMALAPNKS